MDLPPLCEILDEKNRPLCLLNHADALEQGLRHRAFAVLLRERGGRFILRKNGDVFGCFHYSFVPYGIAAEDAARAEIAQRLNLRENFPDYQGRMQVCPESKGALVDIFLVDLPKNIALELEIAPHEWLFLKKDELFALQDNDLLEPFLRHSLALGFWGK